MSPRVRAYILVYAYFGGTRIVVVAPIVLKSSWD